MNANWETLRLERKHEWLVHVLVVQGLGGFHLLLFAFIRIHSRLMTLALEVRNE
jgi:hypothetical protein